MIITTIYYLGRVMVTLALADESLTLVNCNSSFMDRTKEMLARGIDYPEGSAAADLNCGIDRPAVLMSNIAELYRRLYATNHEVLHL